MKNKSSGPLSSSDIRQAFLEYFQALGHEALPSSSLVPSNDPTLLFTNAGMVQFKDVFLGQEKRPYTRAVTSQRCVRAGGKHNDLENVGYTARHHTFFEMLGTFSFGDYFKRDAIFYAWKFLTQVLHLPQERLWVTVFKDDDEAAEIWLTQLGVSPERFSRCGEKDNFWSMGDTGPCGPCTEIFYDHGPEIAGGPPGSADAEADRYIEIWNLVFMQFNRDNQGNLHPLPKPSVDTGMGLERITAVVQGVHNNYDIDIFHHLIQAIIRLTVGVDPKNPSLKVIADHIRSCSFLIADGILPSNEGRGYVLRRIMRRAIRHGSKLGLRTPFLAKLVQPLIEVMGDVYPELKTQNALIERVLTQEENQFARTLEQGLHLLKEYLDTLKSARIAGEMAFKLYDTYGFPLDLTQDIAREHDLAVDLEGFEFCMQQQRALSQASNHFSVDHSNAALLTETSVFHGYEVECMQSNIAVLLRNNQKIDELMAGSQATVILQSTPFYAESGGQVGDKGQLISESGAIFRVDDTQKLGNAIAHFGELLNGSLQQGERVEARVDASCRAAIRLNHTATHLLHAALKQILGSHVQQKGSLVDAERARFDFSHSLPLTSDEIKAIEQLVNERVRANDEVLTQLMELDEAKSSGAVALFGEKYADKVRVLTLGDFSKELCGGTHAIRTGDIGLFKIVAEYGVSSGIRRIEMMTGAYALNWIQHQLMVLDNAADVLKTTPMQVTDKLLQLANTVKQHEKTLSQLKEKLASNSSNDLLGEVREINGISFLIKQLIAADGQTLRTTLDQLKSKIENAVIVLYATDADKMQVIAGVSKAILGRVPTALVLVKHLCGRGGGREDMAQGGGTVPDDLDSRLLQIEEWIRDSAS